MRLFSREKKGCFAALMPLELDAKNPCFVGYLLQMNMKTLQIDGCLSCIPLLLLSAASSMHALFAN